MTVRRVMKRLAAQSRRRRAARQPYSSGLGIKGWLSLITGGAAVSGIAIGLAGWTLDFLRPTVLEIDPPTVIEFRCSTSTVQGNNCGEAPSNSTGFEARVTDDRSPPNFTPRRALPSLSVTGAFRILARGSTRNAATLRSAKAVISFPEVVDHPEFSLDLTAYWSGSLIPGKNVALTQVVPRAMRHGDVLHQEIWFMPLPGSCLKDAILGCKNERNASFLDWWLFRKYIMERTAAVHEGSAKLEESSIILTFSFRWETSTGLRWLLGLAPSVSDKVDIPCTIELTRSHFDLAADPGFVTHAVRCAESFIGAR